MPWSSGCNLEVVFFGRKTALIFLSMDVRDSTPGCAGQWSISKMAFGSNFLSLRCLLTLGTNSSWNQSSKMAAVIQAFFEWEYNAGSVFMLTWCRHRGLPNFPITRGANLCDPVLLQQSSTVILSLYCLNPSVLFSSLLAARVLSGSIL